MCLVVVRCASACCRRRCGRCGRRRRCDAGRGELPAEAAGATHEDEYLLSADDLCPDPRLGRGRSRRGLQDIPQVLRPCACPRARPRRRREGAAACAAASGPGCGLRSGEPSHRRRHQGRRQSFLRAALHAQRRRPCRTQRPADGLLRALADGLAHAARRVPDADLQAPAGLGEPHRRDAARRGGHDPHACPQDRGGRRALRHACGHRAGRAQGQEPRAHVLHRSRRGVLPADPGLRPRQAHRRQRRARALRRQERPPLQLDRPLPDGERPARRRQGVDGRAQAMAQGRPRARQTGDVAERVLRVLSRAQGRRASQGPAGRDAGPAHPRTQPGRRPRPSRPGPADLRQRRRHEARQQGRCLQSADGGAGRRLRHQGPRARRHLLRLRRCGRALGGRHQARRQVHRAAAERHAGASRAASGKAAPEKARP